MALSCQVIYLIRHYFLDDADKRSRIRKVAVMELDLIHDMFDTSGVCNTCAACDAVNFVSLLEQELGQI